jgi:type I restriction enzyme S subunit
MQIEADRTVVEQTPLSLAVREELRRRARDLLLPKLISGEVDVENIDVQMPNNGGA